MASHQSQHLSPLFPRGRPIHSNPPTDSQSSALLCRAPNSIQTTPFFFQRATTAFPGPLNTYLTGFLVLLGGGYCLLVAVRRFLGWSGVLVWDLIVVLNSWVFGFRIKWEDERIAMIFSFCFFFFVLDRCLYCFRLLRLDTACRL